MPRQTARVRSEQELTDSAKRSADKKVESTKTANSYPLKFLQSLGGKSLYSSVMKPGDTRAFFDSPFMRRTCLVPTSYMTAICSPIPSDEVHLNSFVLDADSLTATHLELIGDGPRSVLDGLLTKRTLELDSETDLPSMAKEGDAKNKRPVIVPTDSVYTPAQTFMRYFPAFVAGDKDLNIGNTLVSIDGSPNSMGLTDALFTKFLYGIDPIGMPEPNSDAATALWESNVRSKLFLVAGTPIVPSTTPSTLPVSTDGQPINKYGIYYTICMPGIEHVVDFAECQGKRRLQQAKARLVKHWVDLTELLVGPDSVPRAMRMYLEDDLGAVDFDRTALSVEAGRVCTSTWQSLSSAGTKKINSAGRTVNEISDEVAKAVTDTWAEKEFANPSIDITIADGTINTTLMFNSSEAERAMFGLYFTKAGYQDAESYHADSYRTNLKKMNVVFKAVGYAVLGKPPPDSIVLFDAEGAIAINKSRKRSTPVTQNAFSTMFAEMMEFLKRAEERCDAKFEALETAIGTLSLEHAKELRRAKKFRSTMRVHLPTEDPEDAE